MLHVLYLIYSNYEVLELECFTALHTHTHEDEERESLLQLNNRKINQCAPIYSLLIYSIHVSLMYESAIGKVKNTIGDNAN